MNVISPAEFLERHAMRAASAVAGMMVLFFATFVWALAIAVSASAAAGNQAACNGENLIARFAAEDPDRLARIEEKAAGTLNGEGIFWRVSREGIADSWLLGTMHMADEAISNVEGTRREALDAAGKVIVENVESLDREKAMAGLVANKDLTLITDGTTLADRLDAETLARLKPALEKRGMPEHVAMIMQPWVIATAVSLPACEQAAKQQGGIVLDARIAQIAGENGQELAGLETMREQFSAMASVPEDFQVQSLMETLEMGSRAEDMIATMKALYLSEQIGMILPFVREMTPRTDSTGGYGSFSAELVDKRNAVMAERALPHLEEGNVFIAVGALHLPGETGLVEALRAAGYTVERAR